MIGRSSRRPTRSTPELVTLAIAVALLALLIGGVVLLEERPEDGRPHVTVTPRAGDAYRRGDAWFVPVTIENASSESVSAVSVEVTSVPERGPETTRTIDVGFLAGGDAAHAVAGFDADPARGAVEAVVASVVIA